jgi:hypothetical protein
LATPLHIISGSENQAIHYPMHNMWTGSGVNPYSMYNPGSMMAYGNQTSRLDASSMLMQSPHLPVSASHVSSPGLSRMQHKAGHTGSHATPPGLHGGATSSRVDDHLFSAAQHTLQSQRNFDMQHGYPGWTNSPEPFPATCSSPAIRAPRISIHSTSRLSGLSIRQQQAVRSRFHECGVLQTSRTRETNSCGQCAWETRVFNFTLEEIPSGEDYRRRRRRTAIILQYKNRRSVMIAQTTMYHVPS